MDSEAFAKLLLPMSEDVCGKIEEVHRSNDDITIMLICSVVGIKRFKRGIYLSVIYMILYCIFYL